MVPSSCLALESGGPSLPICFLASGPSVKMFLLFFRVVLESPSAPSVTDKYNVTSFTALDLPVFFLSPSRSALRTCRSHEGKCFWCTRLVTETERRPRFFTLLFLPDQLACPLVRTVILHRNYPSTQCIAPGPDPPASLFLSKQWSQDAARDRPYLVSFLFTRVLNFHHHSY